MEGMKKMFAAAALAAAITTTHGTEEVMKQTLTSWQQQVAAYEDALQKAPSDEARAGITPPDARQFAPQLWQSINGRTGTRPNPRGKGRVATFEFEQAWALPAIVWILDHQQAFGAAFSEDEQAQLTYFGEAIIDSINRIHFSNPAAAGVCPGISASSNVRDYELLQKIYQRNQNKEARAAAALGMSLMLNDPMISSVEGSESMARAKRLYYLKQAILLGGREGRFGSQTIAEVAMEQAYFLRHLSVGAIAPLLHLKDAQGTSHSFPTPGKLTLLVFWNPDTPSSAAMLRDADKIKAQFPGVEICPIMPHCSPEEHPKLLSDCGVDSSFIDDADGKANHTYRIGMYPTAVLINKRCQILYGGTPDMKLQNALEAVTAAEKGASQPQRTRVIVEDAPAPVLQPGSTPKNPAPASDNKVPELREMPEF